MHNKDYYLLLSLQETLNKILRYSSEYHSADEFFHNDRDFDATMMNFIVMGEIAGKLSDELKADTPGIDWSKIYTFRSILAHHYFGINVDIVWEIISVDLPKLKDDLTNFLSQ